MRSANLHVGNLGESEVFGLLANSTALQGTLRLQAKLPGRGRGDDIATTGVEEEIVWLTVELDLDLHVIIDEFERHGGRAVAADGKIRLRLGRSGEGGRRKIFLRRNGLNIEKNVVFLFARGLPDGAGKQGAQHATIITEIGGRGARSLLLHGACQQMTAEIEPLVHGPSVLGRDAQDVVDVHALFLATHIDDVGGKSVPVEIAAGILISRVGGAAHGILAALKRRLAGIILLPHRLAVETVGAGLRPELLRIAIVAGSGIEQGLERAGQTGSRQFALDPYRGNARP